MVRQGDDGWFNIARWTYYALLEAEELGVTQANVDEMLGSDNPAIKRLLGVEGDFGTPMGLTKDWAYQIIKLVGNYAETYERTSARTRRSGSRAASTRCGATAASSTPRRSANTIPGPALLKRAGLRFVRPNASASAVRVLRAGEVMG